MGKIKIVKKEEPQICEVEFLREQYETEGQYQVDVYKRQGRYGARCAGSEKFGRQTCKKEGFIMMQNDKSLPLLDFRLSLIHI